MTVDQANNVLFVFHVSKVNGGVKETCVIFQKRVR